MVSRRAEIVMTPHEVASYLRDGRTIVLVTQGPDGLPDPVPMWYVVDPAGAVRMRTYATSQKAANLRRQPRVACLVCDGERYAELRGVQLTGRVELVTDPEWIADVVAGLMVKYEGLAAEHVPAARAAAVARAGKQVGLLLHVDRAVSWDHRKLDGAGR